MLLKPKIELSTTLLAGFLLALVASNPARGQNPNVVTDPTFSGQSSDFQSGGTISPDWNYTADYLNFGGPWTLVSQTIQTPGSLYIYDIDVIFTTVPAMDFFVYWDGSAVDLITGANGFANNNILVTAVGPTSEIGFVGSPTAWAALAGVDVSWSGEIDPPPSTVPDSPVGFGVEAGLLAGLCWMARLYRLPELRPCRQV